MLYPAINYAKFTDAEIAFLTSFADLPYANGDVLYYNSGQLRRLPIGSDGQALVLVSGLPSWGSASVSGLTPGGALFGGSSGAIAQDAANLFFDDTNNRLGLLTNAPTHTETHGFTSTGIAFYNTADQTTNYERYVVQWASNVFQIKQEFGGSANTGRILRLQQGTSSTVTVDINSSAASTAGFLLVNRSTSGANVNHFATNGTTTAASGTNGFITAQHTINQSGSAGYTAFLANITESTTGSGPKLLIDLQVGSSSKFKIDNAGHVTVEGVTSTGATGTGAFVFATSPTLVTPNIGVATATSVTAVTAGLPFTTQNSSDTSSNEVARFESKRSTVTANDEGYLTFRLNNSTPTVTTIAKLIWKGTTLTAGSEAGEVRLHMMVAGVMTDKYRFTPSAYVPTTNDSIALGSTSLMWSDLFLASGAVLNFNNGDVTLTHASNLLTFAGGQFTFGANTAYFTETDNGNSGTSKTIDWTASNKQKLTLTGNCTLTFTAPGGPCSLVLKLVQDATGSRTVTWPAAVHWSGGTTPTLTTTAGQIDVIALYYDGTNYYGSASLNYSP